MRAADTDHGRQILVLARKLSRARGTTVPAILRELELDLREQPAGRALARASEDCTQTFDPHYGGPAL